MKIKFLGTAAAEAFPAFFCACDNCKKARKSGGKNIRSRSQAIINDDLLIDFPPDSYYHFERFNIDTLKIKSCLITHSHCDHFYIFDTNVSLNGASHPPKDWHGFTLCGSQDLEPHLQYILTTNKGFFNYNKIEPFKPFNTAGYTVTALKALHGTENPYIYIVEKDGKTILYAHDTDIIPDDSMKYIRENQFKFDLVSMDCTEGAFEKIPYVGHMCLGSNLKLKEKLLNIDAIDDKTILVLNHFSHNGLNATYDDFAPVAAKEGFLTSYDGMEIEI